MPDQNAQEPQQPKSEERGIIRLLVLVAGVLAALAAVLAGGQQLLQVFIHDSTTTTSSSSTSGTTTTTEKATLTVTCSAHGRPVPGETITLTYNIDTNERMQVGLGAGLYDENRNDQSTGFGDVDQLQLPAGQTSGSRLVEIPNGLPSGRYELTLELWPPNEIGKQGVETFADPTCGLINIT